MFPPPHEYSEYGKVSLYKKNIMFVLKKKCRRRKQFIGRVILIFIFKPFFPRLSPPSPLGDVIKKLYNMLTTFGCCYECFPERICADWRLSVIEAPRYKFCVRLAFLRFLCYTKMGPPFVFLRMSGSVAAGIDTCLKLVLPTVDLYFMTPGTLT